MYVILDVFIEMLKASNCLVNILAQRSRNCVEFEKIILCLRTQAVCAAMNSERKKSMGPRWGGMPSSTMKTPTRPRFTIGGTQINSTSKNDFDGGQARFSMGTVPASARRTSLFRSLTSNYKDTRPLSSKDYQNEMIRKIYAFLLEHDGENCLPEKAIRSPTKQDFIIMFESIYQHLSPDFQLKNVNEEVATIFRELGYITPIKPSTMQTIGASHTWPTLLGALTWLIDVVNVKNSLQDEGGQQLLLGDDSSGTLKAYKYSWLNAGFKEYVQNREAIRNENFFDNKMHALRNWHEQQEDFESQQETIRAALDQLREDCAELESEKGSVDRYRDDIVRVDDDIKKATEYKEEIDEDVKALSVELNAAKEEKDTVAMEAEEHRFRVSELQGAIREQEQTQGLCDRDARALVSEVDENKLQMRKLKAELEDLCKRHWHEVPKCRKALEEQQGRYQSLIVGIKSLLMSALHECPTIAEETPKDARALYSAVLNDAKSLLLETESQLLQRRQELEGIIRQHNFESEEIQQNNVVERRILRDKQREESRADRQRKHEREEWEKDLIAAETEVERLENDKELLENRKNEIGSMKRDLETMKAENLQYSKLLKEKQSIIKDEVLSRFHIIVSDLDQMKEAREWMTRKLEELGALRESFREIGNDA
ncbi:unnamed protein product [Cylicocyclus nassatus]|uniref:Kinetochore protein NDC80 n=1 Tax=Cylicocyclus nassatus TaxID=53992 RepID=A0AA36DL57_CYLNA|nr:unnamed protein product [Cylicocyclus nassatus]